MRKLYRYTFRETVALDEIEESLVLAIFATESLHGEVLTRLEVRHLLDADTRQCVIDASTVAGRDLNKVFVGLLIRQFGEGAFQVKRINDQAPAETVRTAA